MRCRCDNRLLISVYCTFLNLKEQSATIGKFPSPHKSLPLTARSHHALSPRACLIRIFTVRACILGGIKLLPPPLTAPLSPLYDPDDQSSHPLPSRSIFFFLCILRPLPRDLRSPACRTTIIAKWASRAIRRIHHLVRGVWILL